MSFLSSSSSTLIFSISATISFILSFISEAIDISLSWPPIIWLFSTIMIPSPIFTTPKTKLPPLILAMAETYEITSSFSFPSNAFFKFLNSFHSQREFSCGKYCFK